MSDLSTTDPARLATVLEQIRARAASVGLCAACTHLLPTPGRHRVYVRCALAGADPRFSRYPTLPVVACRGFVAR